MQGYYLSRVRDRERTARERPKVSILLVYDRFLTLTRYCRYQAIKEDDYWLVTTQQSCFMYNNHIKGSF